ncbi:MAG TPA: DUF5652 family protein [Patescibacteria group bacterium]|nr:DUF5652 family protein [Patescibacteria group bacterium]
MTPNSPIPLPILFILLVWSLIWRGVATWKAANNKQRNWFIFFILPINTAGIIELIYLFKFCKKPLTIEEIKSWLPKAK